MVFLCGSVEGVVQDCTVRSFSLQGVFKAPASCMYHGWMFSRSALVVYSLPIAHWLSSTAQART